MSLRQVPYVKRAALAALLVILGVFGLGATHDAGTASKPTIVLADGGGSFGDAAKKAVYKPCAKQLGININVVNYDYSIGLIRAQVAGPKEWDVVSTGPFLTNQEAAKIFAPIDTKIVHAKGLTKDLRFRYWVPYDVTPIILTWNTDNIKTPATSWADIWDPQQYPGAVMLERNAASYNIEMALLADGVKPAQMYPIDYDRAFRKLDELRKLRKIIFYGSGADLITKYQTGIGSIGTGWLGRVVNAKSAGAPIANETDDAILAYTSWAVLKTSKNTQAAMRFVNCAVTAQREAAMDITLPGQGPANVLAMKLLPPKIRNALPNPTSPQVLRSSIKYWSLHFDEALKRWTQWLAKG